MTLIFDPALFSFEGQDIRIEGAVTSGGTSLSGIDEPIATDGGGYVVAEFSNGGTFEPADNLAWRAATTAMDNGAAQVIVFFRDRAHQPVGWRYSDDPLETGAIASATASAPLRSTSLALGITSEKPLLPGMWFSVQHPTWGWRAYNIIAVEGSTVRFRPPLREAVAAGTALEFDEPRCAMRLAQATSNAINAGLYADPSISFVEDMRKPAP